MGASELAILITAKDSAGKVLEGLRGDIDKTSGKLEKFAAKTTDVGAKMSLGLTTPLSVLGLVSVDAASDMAESASKMQVVFGDATESVKKFASAAATNLGMSKQAATEAAGTFGNLFVALGLGQAPAAELSTNILKLAADLASFNNLKPEEALEKLRSGLVGEAEPLRALGVNINEVTVKAKAMELGLASASGELTEAAKVQARYALIMEQTKTAQGDFARTSDGLANSTRIAKSEFADLQAEMGEQLLPVAIQVVGVAKGMLSAFAELSPEMKTTTVVTLGLLAAIGPLTTAVGVTASVVAFLTSKQTLNTAAMVAHKAVTLAVTTAQGAMTAAQWLLNAALTANPIGVVVVALAALAAGVIWAYQNVDWFRNIVDTAFGFIGAFIPQQVGNAKKAFEGLYNAIKPVIDAIGDLLDLIGRIPNNISLPSLPSLSVPDFATGGIVPGPIGMPQLAVVHGGERIAPAGRGGGGDINVYVTVQGSITAERDLAETIRTELLRIKSRNTTTGL